MHKGAPAQIPPAPATVKRPIFVLIEGEVVSVYGTAIERDRAFGREIRDMLPAIGLTIGDLDEDYGEAERLLRAAGKKPPARGEAYVAVPADGDTKTIDSLHDEVERLSRRVSELSAIAKAHGDALAQARADLEIANQHLAEMGFKSKT